MKRKLLPRIFITLLGAALILWGAGKIALGIIGEPEKAVITHIRREGGELTDIKPGRYTYNISYTFTLPDGKEINGFTKQIGDGVYLKADGTSTVQIRYLPGFPYFSALEKEVGMGVGPLVLIVAGGVLVFLMVRPTKVDNGHK
ncbi:MAG: hypothetical protein VB081_08625 [Christensenella sp.]|uniref:hypothetical protein n=1 Tax=Christensenella sp. TaxID=1935934 RepID=UPI002B20453E|nr:hypothetical protein [Christensenella sp.]MEA5003548.1 hypothetical protein [Christensenella sp.]